METSDRDGFSLFAWGCAQKPPSHPRRWHEKHEKCPETDALLKQNQPASMQHKERYRTLKIARQTLLQTAPLYTRAHECVAKASKLALDLR